MKICPYCDHERMFHDSWGCKVRCGCEVSIIYITSHPTEIADSSRDAEILKKAKELVATEDLVQESNIKMLRQREAYSDDCCITLN